MPFRRRARDRKFPAATWNRGSACPGTWLEAAVIWQSYPQLQNGATAACDWGLQRRETSAKNRGAAIRGA